MGTRSDLIVHRKDGTWKRVYCHWDGYIEHNGKILQEHYNSQELAEKLVKPGDMSSLGPKCNKPKGHSYENKVDGYTVYYGRDRGEKDVDGYVSDNLQDLWPCHAKEGMTGTEFTYVWTNGQWFVGNPDDPEMKLGLLQDAIDGKYDVSGHPVKAFGGNFVLGHH